MKSYRACPVWLIVFTSIIAASSIRSQELGTAWVRHAPSVNGRVEGSIQQMTAESLTLNGGAVVTQDLLIPGSPAVRSNGRPAYGGTTEGSGSASPASHQVTLNGNASLRHVVRRTNPVALPNVMAPSAPAGTRNVVLNSTGQSPGSFSTLRHLTLNGNVGQVAVPAGAYGDFTANAGSGFTLGVSGSAQPSVYHFQRLTLNGQSQLKVVGPVVVTVAHELNGNGAVGVAEQPGWLTLNIRSGGLTLNGGARFYGHVNAPNGSVIINGNSQLIGGLAADRLIVNGGALLRLASAAPANRPPVAVNQSLSTAEDVSLVVTLSATDPDGDDLTYATSSAPAHGSISGSGGVITYIPAPDFHGTDSFTFKANDGAVDSNVATVTVAVTPVNDRPTAEPLAIQATEDMSGGVVLVGGDADGDVLSFEIIQPPRHGTLSGSAPSLVYLPAADYHGLDEFTYVSRDSALQSEPAVVSIQIAPVNDAPRVEGATYVVNEDESVGIVLVGADVDGDALTFEVQTGPQHGVLAGDAPHLTYSPRANFSGSDSFTYRAFDGVGHSESATILVHVTNQNDAPVAHDVMVSTMEDSSVDVGLLAHDPDGDALTFVIVAPPQHGTLAGSAPHLTYSPEPDFNGSDSFTFRVRDVAGIDSNLGTARILVDPVNDAPVAHGQVLAIDEDTPVEITLSGSDVEGTSLTFSLVIPPQHGSIEGSGPAITYTPAANYSGEDSFTFVANDGELSSVPASISISIVAVNDAPVAAEGFGSLSEDTSLELTLEASDVEGGPLSFSIQTPPQHGTIESVVGTAGGYLYTPDGDYHGWDSFVFTVNDGELESAPATFHLTIVPLNDAPEAQSLEWVGPQDTPIDFTLAGFDADGDELIYTITMPPAHGTLTGAAPHFTYTPAFNYRGDDVLEFIVSDGEFQSGVATVRFTLTPVEHAPVAMDGHAVVDEDTAVELLLEASDVDGDTLVYTIVKAPERGTLEGAGAEWRYVPELNFNGTDHFQFKVSDGGRESNIADFEITVMPVNDAPIAIDRAVLVEANSTVEIQLRGEDIDGDEIEFIVVDPPAHGSLTGSREVLVYIPAHGYVGSDSFTFVASDGRATSADAATVSIVVSGPLNQPPVVDAGLDATAAFGASAEVKPFSNIILNHDEWTLTDQGFASSASAGQFALNLAKWFTGGRPGKFLAYTNTMPGSISYAYTGTALRAAMEGAGHTWVTSSTIPFTLENLRQFDAVFLCANQVDNSVLIDYVNAGGSVYISAGTKVCGCDADVEAGWYATFLNAFGLAYGYPYNQVRGTLPVSSEHPIFEGLSTLYYDNGNPVIVLDWENPLTSIVNVSQGRNLMALYSRSGRVATSMLSGSASDDHLPDGSVLQYRWEKLDGPGLVYFDDAGSSTTEASFTIPGIYTLQFSASDGEHTASDTVTITVEQNDPPQVFAGGDAMLRAPVEPFRLRAIASDDGIPRGGELTFQWRQLDGPEQIAFDDATLLRPTVSFPVEGIYILELSASDGHLESSSFTTIRVGVRSPIAPEGITAWWPANGHAREVIRDEQPLRVQQSKVAYASGRVSLAFDFDGADRYWKAGAGPSTAIGADAESEGATVEFWMKMADHQNERAIFSWRNGPYLRTTYYGQRLSLSWGTDIIESGEVLTAGSWSHCAVTYDRASGLARIYHNGVLLIERAIGSFFLPTTDEFSVGWRSGSNPFKGQIDEVTLYKRSLTPEEIGTIYRAGSSGKIFVGGNSAPEVSAGPDVATASPSDVVLLAARLTDDGKPAGARVDWRWTKISGPGEVEFAVEAGSLPDSPETTARFSEPGLYSLQLESDDGAYGAKDLVEVRVGQFYPASLPSDVSAWWPGNGNPIEVRSGHAAMPWNVPEFADGLVGMAFDVDGADDYWRASAAPALAVGSTASSLGATIELWMRLTDLQSDRAIFSWIDGPYLRTSFYSQRVNVGWGKIGGGDVFETGNILTAGVWTHCAATYDRASGIARIYVNGVLQNERAIGSFALPTTGDVLIGTRSGEKRFKGQLDEVTLYDRALSPAEIGAIYQSGSAGKLPLATTAPLVVEAGPDIAVRDVSAPAALAAHFALGEGSSDVAATWSWSKVSGPGDVTFEIPNGDLPVSPATHAWFAAPGFYLLKLEGRDHSRTVSDLVEVRVGQLYPAELPEDARAWWTGNGTSVETYTQQEATAWNLAKVGEGHISQGFVLDGIDDRWSASNPRYAVGSGGDSAGASVELWLNMASLDRDRGMWSWSGGPFLRSSYYSTRLVLGWGKPGGGDTLETAGILQAGTWMHCVATYNRTTGVSSLYIDGILQASRNIGSFILPTTGTFWIGAASGLSTFKGGLDEVTLYDRPLTPAEVGMLFESGSQGKPPAVGNAAPVVFAHSNVVAATVNEPVELKATISDDGLPHSMPVAWRWSILSGPGGVGIANPEGSLPDAPVTSVTFSNPGLYLFRIEADDGYKLSAEIVEVRVAQAYPAGLPTDARAWWKANGNSVETYTGIVAMRRNLPTFADGRIGQAFTLPGSGSWTTMAPEFAVGAAPESAGATVELWLNMADHERDRAILSWAGGPYMRTSYYSQRLYVAWGKPSGGDAFETGNLLQAGQWAHCAATYDRSSGLTRLYINGVERVSKNIGSFLLPTMGEFAIGSMSGQYSFKGQLDEVTLYDRALTTAEIAAIYQAGPTGKPDIVLNRAPEVAASVTGGPVAGSPVLLSGVANDDGLPNPPGTLTYEWSKISGPGLVTFDAADQLSTTATFSSAGTYSLQFLASDSDKTGSATLEVLVEAPPSTPPTIAFEEPADGASLPASTTFELVVQASDSDGTIARVEFFLNGVKLGGQTLPELNKPTTYFWPIIGGLPEGSYTFTAKAYDNASVTAETIPITVHVVTDVGPPSATIFTPAADARISAPVEFTGIVASTLLKRWSLEYRLKVPQGGTPEPWIEFAGGTSAVGEGENPGVLGSFDPSSLINGLYEVRLTATDTSGRAVIDGPIPMIVEGNMKIGAFAVAFEDLSIPTPGIPIAITRTYDSRDARVGDFGPGWRIALNNIRVQKNRHLGEAWWQTPQAGSGIQFYDVLPIDERVVTVVFPDGETHRFRAGSLVKNRAGDPDYRSFGVVVRRGKYRFYPVGDTTSTLEPLNAANALAEDFWIEGTGDQDLRADDPNVDPFADTFDASRFRLTTRDGTVFILDEVLGLLEMRDLNGNRLTLERDAQNRVSRVVSAQAAPSGTLTTAVAIHRDATGRVDYIRDPAGNDLDYTYDNQGRLETFTDRELNVTQFRYENEAFPHYLTRIIDPRGVAALRSEFDESGKLIKQIDADGKETVFDRGIDSTGRFEKVVDRLGKETTYYYDERGNVTLKIDPLGAQTTYSYYADTDRVKFEVDHYGNVKSFAYDQRGNITAETLGAGTSEDPANPSTGYTTRTSYNDRSAPTQITDPDGRVQTFTYDPTTNNLLTHTVGVGGGSPATTTYTYYSDGTLHTVSDAVGTVTTHTYNHSYSNATYAGAVKEAVASVSAGSVVWRTTRTLYDGQENQVAQIVARTLPDGSTEEVITRFVYDRENRLVATIHPDGHVSETRYTSFGQEAKSLLWQSAADYQSADDTRARMTSYGYDARGNRVSTTYPDGSSESMHFDAENRKAWSDDRRGFRTTFAYDDAGRLRFTIFPDATSSDGTDNPRTETRYDLIGRVTHQIDEAGSVTEFTYENNCGCAMRRREMIQHVGTTELVTSYEYDRAGNVRFVTDPRGNVTETRYDDHGRATHVVHPATDEHPATQTETRYDALGRRVAAVDQEGKITRYRYDPLGRLIEVRQYLDPSKAVSDAGFALDVTDAGVASTRYSYDELGNQQTQTDALGRVTTYWTDNMGRRTKRILPKDAAEASALEETLRYDGWGNLWQRTDFAGYTTTFSYDELNRLTSKSADAAHPSRVFSHAIARIDYDYDADGARTAAQTYDASGTLLYSEATPRDERGRIDYKDTDAGQLDYSYHANGLLKDVVSSNDGGVNVGYRYDGANRLEHVDDTSTGLPVRTTSYTYNANGSLESVTYPNAVVHTYGYDALNRLRTLNVSHNATVLRGYDYKLRASGHRRQVIEGGRTITYTYDELYRLTDENRVGDGNGNNGAIGYTLDKVGNRSARLSSVTGIPNQTNTFNARDWLDGDTYTANGSTQVGRTALAEPPGTDAYDFEERLIVRTKPDGSTINISYDADGIRIAKTLLDASAQPTAITSWLVDTNNLTAYAQVFEERVTTASGETLRVYTYGSDLISQAVSLNDGPATLHYFLYDGHGSVRELTDGTVAITDRYDYDAFGSLIFQSGTTPNAYRYCGEQYDADLGIYYLRARYMSVDTGRFWTLDRYQGDRSVPVSLHKYAYSSGNPITFLDPSGFLSLSELQLVQNVQARLNKLAIPNVRVVGNRVARKLVCAGANTAARWVHTHHVLTNKGTGVMNPVKGQIDDLFKRFGEDANSWFNKLLLPNHRTRHSGGVGHPIAYHQQVLDFMKNELMTSLGTLDPATLAGELAEEVIIEKLQDAFLKLAGKLCNPNDPLTKLVTL